MLIKRLTIEEAVELLGTDKSYILGTHPMSTRETVITTILDEDTDISPTYHTNTVAVTVSAEYHCLYRGRDVEVAHTLIQTLHVSQDGVDHEIWAVRGILTADEVRDLRTFVDEHGWPHRVKRGSF